MQQGATEVQSIPWMPPKTKIEESKPKRGRKSKEERIREQGFDLFVDCIPVKGTRFDLAENIIAAVNTRLKEHTGLPHWSLVDFGKGRGMFLAMLEQEIDEHPPVNPIVLSTKSADGKEALSVFLAGAHKVVRAMV
jgi:hypothetical protein